VAEQPHHHKEY
jgi:hypothetical protein